MEVINTLTPYKTVEHSGIQYSVCRDFNHISRYRGLRQVTHEYDSIPDRYVALETTNPFTTNSKVKFHKVTAAEENRLDIIADNFLGDATYGWVIAYYNKIEDGFTVRSGQTLMIPESITTLFQSGELLGAVSPTLLNLGEE